MPESKIRVGECVPSNSKFSLMLYAYYFPQFRKVDSVEMLKDASDIRVGFQTLGFVSRWIPGSGTVHVLNVRLKN